MRCGNEAGKQCGNTRWGTREDGQGAHPGGQGPHVRLPGMFVHSEAGPKGATDSGVASQPPLSVTHSSMSTQVAPSPA